MSLTSVMNIGNGSAPGQPQPQPMGTIIITFYVTASSTILATPCPWTCATSTKTVLMVKMRDLRKTQIVVSCYHKLLDSLSTYLSSCTGVQVGKLIVCILQRS